MTSLTPAEHVAPSPATAAPPEDSGSAPSSESPTPLSKEPEYEVRVETYEDVLAAAVDWDEWVALPKRTLEGNCPGCGAEWFGAINAFAFLYIYRCHGDGTHSPCGTLFRGREGSDYSAGQHMAEVFGAFIGYRRRYITGLKKHGTE